MPTQITAQQPEFQKKPQTVLSVEDVDLKIVRYTDQFGAEMVQFAAVIKDGSNRVLLLDNKEFAGTQERSPAGWAAGWLREQLLKAIEGKSAAELG